MTALHVCARAALAEVRVFLIAVQYFTRIPVPAWVGFEPAWLDRAARHFPLVGALVGTLVAAAWWLLAQILPQPVAVALAMATSLLVTGAFHEDGFADACDGFGGGCTRERTLEIMKDSRVGAFGAIGIASLLLTKFAVLAAMPAAALSALLVAAHVCSRGVVVVMTRLLPYVSDPATSKSKPVARSLRNSDVAIALVLCAGCTALAMVAGSDIASPTEALGGALAAMLLASAWMARLFVRRIGGVTGDCLGAAQQVAEVAFLAGALAVLVGGSRG